MLTLGLVEILADEDELVLAVRDDEELGVCETL